MEIAPRMTSDSLSCANTRIDRATMGISVISGAAATFRPFLRPCRRVSEITRASMGPGESPAANPNKEPETR